MEDIVTACPVIAGRQPSIYKCTKKILSSFLTESNPYLATSMSNLQ